MTVEELVRYLLLEVPLQQRELLAALQSGAMTVVQAIGELDLIASSVDELTATDPMLAPRAARALALGSIFMPEGVAFLNRKWISPVVVSCADPVTHSAPN